MGYFSNTAIKYEVYEQDHSITSAEQQLLWRLEDLQERLCDLASLRDDGVCFCENDLRYVLPKDFFSASDVRNAIELTINDLAERHGIYVNGQPVEEIPEVDEITSMQISFLDLLAVQSLHSQTLAA